eukprot:8149338-Alexandrium_andersonii.AAC.1
MWWMTAGPNDLVYMPAGAVICEKVQNLEGVVGVRTGCLMPSVAQALDELALVTTDASKRARPALTGAIAVLKG